MGLSSRLTVSVKELRERKRHPKVSVKRHEHVKRRQEDCHLQAKERGLRGNQPSWHLDLGLVASRNVR